MQRCNWIATDGPARSGRGTAQSARYSPLWDVGYMPVHAHRLSSRLATPKYEVSAVIPGRNAGDTPAAALEGPARQERTG